MLALFVNAAILILSAASFHSAGKEVAEIQDAYHLLGPMLGTGAAEYSIRSRAASFRAKFDTNGNTCRSDRNGRFP